MTAAVYRNTPALSIPPTQDTAPVVEFTSLFTHDIRKKAKKWQDGFLRYHTFNKRIMVYDEHGHFVGDSHWTGTESLQEGEALTLQSCPVMVEVGDCKGETQTDLTGLRQSKNKSQGSEIGTAPRRAPINVLRDAQSSSVQRDPPTQLKHRSLNALLGTPKGPIGKAKLPQKSPYEQRRALEQPENELWEERQPPKRARLDSGPAWSVTRTTKTPRPTNNVGTVLKTHAADVSKRKKKTFKQPVQSRLDTQEFIELSDDDGADDANHFLPGFSSDALSASSPPSKAQPSNMAKGSVRSSSPAFQTQQMTHTGRPQLARKHSDQNLDVIVLEPDDHRNKSRHRGGRAAIPLVRSETKQAPVDHDHDVSRARTSASSEKSPAETSASSRPLGMIRLAGSSSRRKGTLLCQDQLTKKPKSTTSDNAHGARDVATEDSTDPGASVVPGNRRSFGERLAAIDKKNGSTSLARLKTSTMQQASTSDDRNEDPADQVSSDTARSATRTRKGRKSHEVSAIVLGRLDRMMLPPPKAPSRSESPIPVDDDVDAIETQCSKSKAVSSRQSPILEARKERIVRQVLSETLPLQASKPKRPLDAPVRYTPTPSPTKRSREPTPAISRPTSPTKTAASKPVPPSKTYKQRKPLAKSVSLNVTSNGTSTVLLGKPFQAPGKQVRAKEPTPESPKDVGPWSREAFDLFTWRPPNWDEEKWCLQEAGATND